jgi:hypothetical protein
MNPLNLLGPYKWLAYAAVVAAAFGWHVYDKHEAVEEAITLERAEQTKLALASSEAARAKEQELQTRVRKVANDYQTEKAKRAADARAADERLRELQTALGAAAGGDTTATTGTDGDPRLDIIAECARTAVQLDKAVKDLAGQTSALQRYADSLRVK